MNQWVTATVRMLLVVFGVLLIAVTVLPVLETNQWWVRVWDFPRVQIGVASTLVAALLLLFALQRRDWLRWLCTGVALTAVFQLWRILPYTPLWPHEMATAEFRDGAGCTTVLIANVLMENRRADRVIEIVRQTDADTVFIVENDQWWSDALAPLHADFSHVTDQPQDNTYGLLFMTRLETDDAQTRYLTDPAIPSVKADLQLPAGDRFTFYGLHPKPPRIGQDTDIRDHELTRVAAEIREIDGEAIVGGDLNDVAWSHTTRLFKRISRMLDPRQGRGLYSSFHADHSWLRWPLDHLFATARFEVRTLKVLSHTGSDHLPVLAEFCLRASAQSDNREQEDLSDDDRDDMQEALSKE